MDRVVPITINSSIEHIEELQGNTGNSFLSSVSQNLYKPEFSKFFLAYIHDMLDAEDNNFQSTKLSIERYEIHTASTSSNTSSVRNKSKIQKKFSDRKREITNKDTTFIF